ncbi:MAG: Ig-like domain-containing protein [Firmicutes bacterium]|nr:Ig-like domain-containing protein [Bacillota bacterium]
MLLLLPLIIVASVLFAIDIVTVQAHIGVSEIKLIDSRTGEEITEDVVDLTEQYIDYLEVVILPARARNKAVKWHIIGEELEEGYDGEERTHIDESNGRVTLVYYGSFIVVVTSQDGNKSAYCNFYVSGDNVQSIDLKSQNGGASVQIQQGGKDILNAVFRPVSATVRGILWASDNEDIATADQNGIITASSKNTGSTTVRVLTVNGEGKEIKQSIAVTVSASEKPYGESFYWDLSLNAEMPAGGTAVSNPNKIQIENKSLLEGRELRIGKQPLILSAMFLAVNNTLKPVGAVWESLNEDIALIDSETGEVNPISIGTVTFQVTYEGDTDEITIEVVRPINYMMLSKNIASEERGIALQTLYGSRQYDAQGNETNALIEIRISLPKNADNSEFDFEVFLGKDNFSIVASAYARFINGNMLELFGDFSGEPLDLTIRVTAKVTPYDNVTISRALVIRVGEGVNCYSWGDIKRASGAEKDIYLFSNIDFYADGGGQILLKSSLYGNGYYIDGQNAPNKSADFNMIHVVESNVKISNLTIKSDDPDGISRPNGLDGHTLLIGRKAPRDTFITGIRIEYSIIENGRYLINSYNAEYILFGSILRNSSDFGINITSYDAPNGRGREGWRSDVIIENVVMSNIVAPAVGLGVESRPSRELTLPHSNLTIRGFFDAYNWQDITSARMLDRDFIEGNALVNATLRQAVTSLLSEELAKSRYNHIRYRHDNVDYMHLGIITAGALHAYEGKVTLEGEAKEQLIEFELAVLRDGSVALFRPLGLKAVHLYLYPSNNPKIKPGDTYEENAELYARLRG